MVLKVWKQKGEEYRVTGYGGWSWISKTHVQRFLPKLPGNTNPNYRKELEGASKCIKFLKLTIVQKAFFFITLYQCLSVVLRLKTLTMFKKGSILLIYIIV